MAKFELFLLFLPAAMLAAGLFGIVHDQISYTVSSEYFTKFKFIQFGLRRRLPFRTRPGRAGWISGLLVDGIPLGCSAARPVSCSARRRSWDALAALVFAADRRLHLGDCASGPRLWLGRKPRQSSARSYAGWYIPHNVENLRRFLCAGYMHNSAYLGGALSIPAAWLFHIIFRAQSPITA